MNSKLWYKHNPCAAFTAVDEIVGLITYGLSYGLIIYFGERMHRAHDQLLQLFHSTNILEDALTREKVLLATTLASIGDALIVTDAQGHVTSINAEAERLLGWKNSGVVHRPLSDVFRIMDERSRRPAENLVKSIATSCKRGTSERNDSLLHG